MSKKIYKKVNKYNTGGEVSTGQSASGGSGGGSKVSAGQIANLASTALGDINDIVNSFKGNEAAIEATKSGINQINATTFNAGNTSDLMNQWSSAHPMNYVKADDLRSDKGLLTLNEHIAHGAMGGLSVGGPWGALVGGIVGTGTGLVSWLGGKAKAKKRANKFNAQISHANDRMVNSFEQAVDNVESENINNFLRNYAAYGGNLNIKNKYNNGGSMNNNRPFHQHGGIFSNGLVYIDNGGSHEDNSLEGVQIGVDKQGIPNLVEEGEIIYNDYVFSNRLKVPKKDREKFKLGNKEIVYSDAVEKLAKESEERPNDAISRRGLEASLNKLIGSQEVVRNKRSSGNKFAYGSYINYPPGSYEWYLQQYDENYPEMSQENTETNEAPVKETDNNTSYSKYSPYSKVSDTQSSDSKWFTFDANNPRNVTKYSDEYKNYNFTAKDAIEWAKKNPNDASLKDFLAKGNTLDSLTDDYVSTHSLDNVYGWLHEARKAAIESKNTSNKDTSNTASTRSNLPELPKSGELPKTGSVQASSTPLENAKKHIENTKQEIFQNQKTNNNPKSNNINNSWESYLRYAPILGSALSLFTNKPNYTNADLISRSINGLPTLGYNPLGNYLPYNPLDVEYHKNKIAAQAAANRRAITNTNYGNRGTANAALLASDYNSQLAMGDAYRMGLEYNQGLRERIAGFNRGTDTTNLQAGLQTGRANADIKQSALRARIQEAMMREQIDSLVAEARSANLTNLFEGIGNIGKEAAYRDMIDKYPFLLYDSNYNYKRKDGGYLTIKNKRRRK